MSTPPSIESPRELLLEQLGRLLSTESVLSRRVLPELVSSTDDDELKRDFARHLEQTRLHAENIRKAFDALGSPPAGKPTPGLDGLRAEREQTVGQIAPALRPGYDCAAAMGTEHYEINAYDAAVRTAEALGEQHVADLLRANLAQDVAALDLLAAHADRLAKKAAGNHSAR